MGKGGGKNFFTDFFWEWDQDASRERYRQLRNASSHAGRQALYMTGLVVVNHLVSAVHAARMAGGAGAIALASMLDSIGTASSQAPNALAAKAGHHTARA